MKLGALVPETPPESRGIEVHSIHSDSRALEPGGLFFAIRGAKHDGTAFIGAAIRNGAVAVVIESGGSEADADYAATSVPVIPVANIRAVYSAACASIHSEPSRKLDCFGVTGTNGKTSVSWIIAHALDALGQRSGILGTLGESIVGGAFQSLDNTTPDALTVHRFLSRALNAGCSAAALEATSQGVVQHRTSAVEWNAAIFTNLTRDHLDLHGTMDEYERAKTRFFTEELSQSGKAKKVAVINIDDEAGSRIAQRLRAEHPEMETVGYSFLREAQGTAKNFIPSIDRSQFEAKLLGETVRLSSRLIGAFNVYNLLAAATCLRAVGFSAAKIAEAFESVPPVPGRLEVVPAGKFHVVVDYAHTPDGLIKAQQSLRPLTGARLITVFGCGGDRDRGKRPLMGQAVAELSDVGVLTSDNPRTEDPERIIDDIVPGLSAGGSRTGFGHFREADRKKAISWAISAAREGDVVLIAGKGHEDYQEIHGVRYPFSDQEVCRALLGGSS